jgi:hypothetical protein
MIEGQNTYFMVDLEKLTRERTGAGAPPLSRRKAERASSKWLSKNAPQLQSKPRASGPHTSGAPPGSAYYLVDLGTTGASIRFQEVLVLMDAAVVESELKQAYEP